MKKFLKSLMLSLCIGMPLAVGLIFFLYTTQKETAFEPVEVKISEETVAEEETLPQQDVITDETLIESEHTEDDIETQSIEKQKTETASVTLSFAGDVYFSELAVTSYEKSGVSALVDEEMLQLMQNTDFLMVNQEFAFSNRGEAMADKEYTLRNDPKYVKILQELGVDAVSIANNHILDFGQTAFSDTLDTLENAEIVYAGGGHNIEEASAPIIQTINGQTFAIFAATRVSPSYDWYAGKNKAGIFQTYDAAELNTAIAEAETMYDHTIVFVHWGIERNETPEEYQRTLAKGYIDAGADLVIGCHPHVLQGFEYYEGVPIVYSLGNYLFGNRTGETLLLNAIFEEDGTTEIQLIPCERINGILTKIQEPEEVFTHLTDLSFDVQISEKGILVP